GPPTPPPSSATEIQDAARTIVPPVPAASTSTSAPAPAQQQPRQDGFTQIFPEIVSLASEKHYKQLIHAIEQSDSDRQPTRLLLTAPLVLAYLTLDDLPPARFALNRLPHNLATSSLGKQLHSLLASTSERKYVNVYTRANALLELVTQPDFDPSLGALLGLMVPAFLDTFRERTFNLLQKAYTSLPLPLAETYLGLPANEVLAGAERSGWSYDPSTQVLTPAQKSTIRQANGFSSLATFDFVADSVARLE
ncbi:COP9 signalosome, partial [Mycena galopus ATCC 62051]